MSEEQCRTCLIKPVDMISLAADHVVCDRVMSVLDLIKMCASVEIELEDGFPQFVCVDCIHLAEKSFEFRVQCKEADDTLRAGPVVQFDVLQFEPDESEEIEVVCEEIEPECVKFESHLEEEEESAPEYAIEEQVIKCEEIEVEEETHSCHICSLIFPTENALAKHSHIHPPNFYQCPHCPVRFISELLLEKHVVKHTVQKTPVVEPQFKPNTKRRLTICFVCSDCGKKCNSLAHLHTHTRKYHPVVQKDAEPISDSEPNTTSLLLPSPNPTSELFKCQICDNLFRSGADLENHMQSVHILTNKPSGYHCKLCCKTLPNILAWRVHTQSHKKQKNTSSSNNIAYKCKICSCDFNTLTDIKEHLNTHSIDGKSLFQHLLYKCTECTNSFNSIYEFFRHTPEHSGSKIEYTKSGATRIVKKRPYKCSYSSCDKTFPSPSALKNHSRTHQSAWPKKCRYCDDILLKWHDYMAHLNAKHEDEKTFVCAQCGKKFFKERNLTSHIKTHTGERNYMCDYCGFSFHAQNNLVAHRRIHTGVKPYKCTLCPMAFPQHAGLRSHLLNHNGEKKFECPTCHKKFLRPGALNTHIKTHTGVKDYACHICGARFGASSTRKKHILTHTGERNHICDFCGKAFSRNSNLNVHRKIHTGETPHVCEICGKGFIQAHVLRSHMNTHRKSKETLKRESKTAKTTVEDEESEELTVLVDLGD